MATKVVAALVAGGVSLNQFQNERKRQQDEFASERERQPSFAPPKTVSKPYSQASVTES
jgi:hypothetical protein